MKLVYNFLQKNKIYVVPVAWPWDVGEPIFKIFEFHLKYENSYYITTNTCCSIYKLFNLFRIDWLDFL